MLTQSVDPLDDHVLRIFFAGNCERFHIKELSAEWREECMNILNEYFLEDPLLSAFGLKEDQDSVSALRWWVEMYLNQNITNGCFLQHENGQESLVAVDVLYVRHIRDEFLDLKQVGGEAFRNYIKFIKLVERHIRYSDYGRRYYKYLTSFGVITRPNYRDLDIEKNMIKKREYVANALRIQLIGSAFLGEKMQSIASSNRYRVIKIFNEENLIRDCGLKLRRAEVFPIKIMQRLLKNRV